MAWWWAAVPAAVVIASAVAMAVAHHEARRLARETGVFACHVRVIVGSCVPLGHRRRRRPTHARWVNDVLVVAHGALRRQAVLLPARTAHGTLTPSEPRRGLGADVVRLHIGLDSGARLEIAARGSDASALAGPFLAVAAQRELTPRAGGEGANPSP